MPRKRIGDAARRRWAAVRKNAAPKRRPGRAGAVPITGTDNRGYRGKFARSLCVVSQVFGIADTETGATKFAPVLIDRVRKLEYPQIMFLPQLPGVFPVDGMLRLDQLQSVFVPHLEATPHCLCDEAQTILKAQLQYLYQRAVDRHFFDERRRGIRRLPNWRRVFSTFSGQKDDRHTNKISSRP